MAPKLTPVKSQTLDLAVLNEMQEPLTIQIDRVKNGQRSPIPLPMSASGSPPGVGWSKEEIQAIEQGWLVNDWAGGGLYIVKVTDSNNPPATLEWRMYWNPADYPEKIPPTLAASASPRLQVVQPPSVTPSPQVPTMQFPAGLPSGGIVPMNNQVPQPAQQYVYYQPPQYSYQQAQQQPQVNPQQQQMIEKLQAELMQQRLEAQARDHAAAMERERTANAQAIARLEAQIRELATVSAKPATDPKLEQLIEQNRLAAQQLETERREREAERRETALRDQMRQQSEDTRRQIEAITTQMQAQIQALTAASANKGMDPMMSMMMEQSRTFAAALGEISRNQGTQLDKFGNFMLNPRDIIAMQKDASGSLDQLSNKLSNVYSNVMDMQQRVIENAMQLNQGGSETVGLIRDGITNAKEMFERYVGGKARAETAAQNASAQAAVAQAQARAIDAQAAVELERLRTQPQVAPQSVQRAVPKPAPQGGISGPPETPAGNNDAFAEWQRSRQMQAAQATSTNAATVTPSGQKVEPFGGARTIHGRTDEQWFTPEFLGELQALRQGVVSFLAGLATGKIEGATPELVADGVMQAQAQAAMMGRNVAAISELLNQGEIVKFVDVLIPDAPDTYKTDVVKMISDRMGEDDDGDEDGEDGGYEAEDGSPST